MKQGIMKQQSKAEKLFWTSIINFFFLGIGILGVVMFVYGFNQLLNGNPLFGFLVIILSAFPTSFGWDTVQTWFVKEYNPKN